MVDLYGLYIAVVFMWQFIIRLRVVPLLFGTSYSLIASCLTRKKNFTRALFPRCLFTVTINGLSERGNIQIVILHFVRQKQFVGRRRLESPSLLCFINRLTG